MIANELKQKLIRKNRLGSDLFAEFVAVHINNYYADEFLVDCVDDVAEIEHTIMSTGSIPSFGIEYCDQEVG